MSRVVSSSYRCLAGAATRSRGFRADEIAQEVSMNDLHVALLLSAVAALFISEPASAQQRADHLIVYKVRAAPRLPVTYTMDLEAVEADLGALGCVLKAGTRAKQLLVPSTSAMSVPSLRLHRSVARRWLATTSATKSIARPRM